MSKLYSYKKVHAVIKSILEKDSRLNDPSKKLKIGFVGLGGLFGHLIVLLANHPNIEFILYVRPGNKSDLENLKAAKRCLPNVTIRPAPCYRGLCEAHWVITCTTESDDEDHIDFTDLNPYTQTKFIHLDGMTVISPSVLELIDTFTLEDLEDFDTLDKAQFSIFL